MDGGTADSDALAEARQVIARQAEEIDQLRRHVVADRAAENLREALSLAATAAVIAPPVPHSRLVEMIVEAAARVINARSGSLLLVDREAQDLVVEHPVGPKAEQVEHLRVPLGYGIAGLVAATGQPMAISDAGSDPRHAADIAERIGYKPDSILCVPLYYNDQVIGVLELLDKQGSSSFSAVDMETLGIFANQAAVAVQQSLAYSDLGSLVGQIVESLRGPSAEQKRELRERAQQFAAGIEGTPAHRNALELAQLVQEISQRGENERKLAETILRAFADYLRSRPDPGAEFWATR